MSGAHCAVSQYLGTNQVFFCEMSLASSSASAAPYQSDLLTS